MKRFIQKNMFFVGLLIVFIIYSLLLIFRSSFIFHGHRYFVLFDDEMISMRYARNLAHGFGLVWNPHGDRVEGITNPLWTMYMAVFHLFLASDRVISLFIQLSGLGFLVANLFFVRKIILFFTSEKIAIVVTLLFTAFYYPLNNWSTILGTEVSVLTFLLTATAYYSLQMIKKQSLSLTPFLLLGIATLVRFDMTVPAFLTFVSLFFFIPKQRKQLFAIGLPILAGFILLQESVRLWYYHDIFPNTYYLKMTGYPFLLRMIRGVYVLHFLMPWELFVISLLGVIFKRNKFMLFFLVIILGQILYSVYVGGDAWEFFGGSNRYISVVMPLFFILFGVTINTIHIQLQQLLVKQRTLFSYTFIILLIFSFFNFLMVGENTFFYATLLKKPETTQGELLEVTLADSIAKTTDIHAKVGIVWAGTVPYFTERTYLDVLGKNDAVIAHEKAQYFPKPLSYFEKLTAFYPGHMKWDYAYMKKQQPDLFSQVYPSELARPILSKEYDIRHDTNGFEFFVLRRSKHVNTAVLEKTEKEFQKKQALY